MSKTALITGASSGIGRELTYLHAAHGHDVLLIARSTAKLAEIKQDIESRYTSKVYVFPFDLTIENAIEEICQYIKEHKLKIDFLINNAGFGNFGKFSESDIDLQQNMIQLNVVVLTKLTHAILPDLIERKGKILNISSVAAFQPGPMMSVYFATKAYVLSFSEAISEELKASGVTVTAFCPGPTESGFMDYSGMGESKMIKGRRLPSSKQVALYGFKAMMKGRPVVIHGLPFKLLVFSLRFTPRCLVRFLTMKIMSI